MSFFSKTKTAATDGKKAARPVKIDWLSQKYGLAQVYSSGLEYCFVSRDWKQCCPMVYCKDFLQDAIQAIYHGKSVSIYGFTYNPETCEPLYMARTRLAIGNASDKAFSEKIPSLLDFINQIEKRLRLVRSKIRLVGNPPKRYGSGVWVMESSNRWMLSPPMLSMYTLLLRVGFCHTKGEDYADTIKKIIDGEIKPYQSKDKGQLQTAMAGIDMVLKHGYAKIFFKDPKKNYPNIATANMHNNTGICSFTSGISKEYVKHWHRDLKPAKADKK
jgi:hypothetical protein